MRRTLGFLGAFTFAIAAHAQSSDAGIASQLFDAGRDLMKRGDYVSACPKLSESARLEPRVGTLARLAECEEKIGHLAAARGHWKDAAELARAQKDDRAQHAEEELKRVDATVPRLILKTESTPPGFAVQLDDVAVGPESMSLPLPIDPGHHTIVATATEKKPWRSTVDAQPNGATTTLEIPALAPTDVTPLPTTGPNAPNEKLVTRHPLRMVGLGMLIGGAFAMTVGSAFSGAAIGLQKAADCTNAGVCADATAASNYDMARGFADATTIAFVAGGVLVAAGLVVIIVAPAVTKHVRVTASGWAVTF